MTIAFKYDPDNAGKLAGARATFVSGEADLPLTSPLHVGDNQLDLMVDRPDDKKTPEETASWLDRRIGQGGK